MARCKVIALYGGAGSGKSQALEHLKTKYHAYTIKADKVAHSLYRYNQPGYKEIKRICGNIVLDDNKNIDRKILAKILFENPSLLKTVNESIHPLVYKKIIELINTYEKKHNHGLIVYEAALLSKRKLPFIDETWFIKSDLSNRIQRLKETRCYDDKKIDSILKSQPNDKDYELIADKIIDNNGTIKELEDKIDAAL